MACEASALKAAVSDRKQNRRRRFFLESFSIRLCYVALCNSGLLRRPVELLFDRFLFEACALEQALHILGHLGVAAEIGGGVGAGESGGVQVFAGDVFGASAFAGPMRVQPMAA